jgi:hypothetical protein
MIKIFGYSLAVSFILFSPVALKADEPVAAQTATPATPAAPSEEATQSISNQLGAKLTELKAALAGMRDAIVKRDLAGFQSYRAQAKVAINELLNLCGLSVDAETKAEEAAEKKGEMQPTPAPVPVVAATPTP